MQVRDLLSAHQLKLQLVTPASDTALRRPIHRCAPTEQLDPTPFLERNALVVTAGIGMNFIDSRVWDGYVERLAQAAAAGVVFVAGIAHERLPGELAAACRKYGVPLFAAPATVPMLRVTHHVDAVLREEQVTRMNTGWALANECAHLANHGAELSTLLARVFTALGAPVAVRDAYGSVIARYPESVRWRDTDDGDDHLSLPLPMGLAQPCRLLLKVLGTHRGDLEATVAPVASILALHLGNSATSDATTLAEMRHFTEVCLGWSDATRQDVAKAFRELGLSQQADTALIVADMSGEHATATWQVRLALHNSFQDVRVAEFNDRLIALAQFPRDGIAAAERAILHVDPPVPLVLRTETASIDELRLAVAHALDLVERVARPTLAPPLGLTAVIAATADRGARDSAAHFLAPLLEHDATRSAQLLPTLRAWLRCDASPRKTCDALYIHRNSLAYRLRKIEDLLGADLTSIEGQATCLMALRLVDRDAAL